MDLRRSADRYFLALLAAALVPLSAIAFALVRAARDVRLALAGTPEPVAGLCRQAVVYTLDPVAHMTYAMFAVAAIAAIGLGAGTGFTRHLRTRRTLRGYRLSAAVPGRLERLAEAAGIGRVTAFDSASPLAFAFGYVRPTVGVSAGLLSALDDRELFAVLLHEAEHVRRRDPLRVLVAGVVARAFFFAPVIASLADMFKAAKEIDADRAVIRAMGSRDALVSALLSAGGREEAGATAGFADALSARISALEGEKGTGVGISLRAAAGTMMSVLVLGAGMFVIGAGAVDAQAFHVCS